MKIIKKTIPILVLTIGLISCGEEKKGEEDKDSSDSKNTTEETTSSEESTEDSSEGMSAVTASEEMTDFISGFNGDYKAVEAALQKYGSTDEIKDHDMGMYNLENPRITGRDGECYDLTCKSGMVENFYVVCWEEGMITSIEEKMAE